MRNLLRSFIFVSLLGSALSATAQQRADAALTRSAASSRLALASTAEATPGAPEESARPVCARLNGQVLDANGNPLVGATVTVKGTPHLYITNSDGRYLVETTIYQGQILEIEAAGYLTREVTLADCNAPVVGLEMAAGTKIKKKGKRAGQIVRFGPADLQ